MKKIVFFLSVLLWGGIFVMAEDPLITIVAPSGSYPLIKNNRETIRWTHSDHFNTHIQNCRIYCGSFVISPPVPVKADSFVWTVGKKADGTYIPLGNYKITIKSPDYDALDGPNISITFLNPGMKGFKLPRFLISKLQLRSVPWCGHCFKVDLRNLNSKLRGSRKYATLAIVHKGRILAKLGKFGPGLALPRSVIIKLDEQSHQLIKNRGGGNMLHVISENGKIINKQPVQLEIAK